MSKLVSVVGTNKRNALYRIWFEGVALANQKVEPGARYDIELRPGGKISCTYCENGARKVSGKMKAGVKVPVLDFNNKAIHAHLVKHGDVKAMELRGNETGFTLYPAEVEQKRLDRVNRFKAMAGAFVISTLFTGGGIFDHAAHAAIPHATSGFSVEVDQGYASVAQTNNPAIGDMNVTPIEYMEDYPQTDLLIAGIPCNGASVSGITKNKLTRPEQHPKVGAMVYWTLKAIEKSQPNYFLGENVPSYQNTASMDILLNVLDILGYEVSTRTIRGSEVGSLEDRNRLFILAHTRGLKPINLNDMEFNDQDGYFVQVGDALDWITDPDAYQQTQPFAKKKAIDKARGNGFSNNNVPVTPSDTRVNTIGAGYAKRRPSEPYLHYPKHGYRWFNTREHAALKDIPARLVENTTLTEGHQILGQAGNYNVVKQIVEQIYQNIS